MVSCGLVMKSVLVAIVLMAQTECGLAAEKLATCCEKLTTEAIRDPILGYLVQNNSVLPCVDAVILQTEKGLFCTPPKARWVASKIRAYRKSKSQTTALPSVAPSRVSLLSMITSATPLSTSSSFSSSSTAEKPFGENMSDQIE